MSEELKRAFLRDDFRDALHGLCIGAVTWQAHPESDDRGYLRGLGMYASFVQARALYEFFYGKRGGLIAPGDTAYANDFSSRWPQSIDTSLYASYMGRGAAAQKRVFHLVYSRSGYPGGSSTDESDHLKNQVVALAVELLELTECFIKDLSPPYRQLVKDALADARAVSNTLASAYGIPNPLTPANGEPA